jgi:hypothetical protein
MTAARSIICAIFLYSLSLVCAAQTALRADRPEVKEGDVWVFQVTDVVIGDKKTPNTQTVKQVTPDRIVVENSSGSTGTFTRDWNQIDSKQGETVTFKADPAWMQYDFPLEVGKKWSPRFTTVSRSGEQTTRWQWTAVVERAESVTVPAGTFDALRIRLDGFYNGARGTSTWTGRRTQTIWYAPAARRTVKSEYEESTQGGSQSGRYRNVERTELISYTPAP